MGRAIDGCRLPAQEGFHADAALRCARRGQLEEWGCAAGLKTVGNELPTLAILREYRLLHQVRRRR